MRYGPGHKEKTREKILDAAGKAFRKHGLEGVGVDGVMKAAGLTAGGFYAHFKNRDALVAEAVSRPLRQSRLLYEKLTQGLGGREWLGQTARVYLSRAHRDHPETGCPLAALQSELGRSGAETRGAVEAELESFLHLFEEKLGKSEKAPATDRAIVVLAQLVGALSLARMVKDEKFSDRILLACRKFLAEEFEAESQTSSAP
ncbi:MAG: TetR/AcrR family transcriptional regulator [Bdellovibrionota bacterium]